MGDNPTSVDKAIWGLRASETFLRLPLPDRFVIAAPSAPTDSDGVNCTFAILAGDAVLYSNDSGKCTVGLQGQTSAGASKKNLKIKVKNANKDKVAIQFGAWAESTSITLKAYGSIPGNPTAFDRSMVREAVSLEIWRQIRRDTPSDPGQLTPWYARLNATTTLFQSPLCSCDCWPVNVYLQTPSDPQPVFYGCYMLRSDNSNQTYLIDDQNPSHYLLQPQHGSDAIWTDKGQLNTSVWEFSSPAKPDTSVPGRLIDWFASCLQDPGKWLLYRDYLNLASWLDYIIHIEVVGSFDSTLNNVILKSYTGTQTSGLWEIDSYDLDESLGVKWNEPNGAAPGTTGWASDGATVFKQMRDQFQDQIRARYAYLRRSGTLSGTTFRSVLQNYARFRADDLAADWALYGTNPIASYPYLTHWYDGRLAWLDTQWGYSA
ncbi:CotH kinase family protein [Gluconobacter frateurii]|uniref:CotH protein n=1 Tax=Gluconobacter frateurii NRIC 0228 TaxID=1307946 RepID=A0ABQ0Q727_9PROT|nr:CotH kinase family protein [Gluconobacter frateurii]GBR07479.1 hypothetical protein AA0228_0017 [Gluconobacter frateurii NRIC 0228]GLP91418.1 hypothetical protein GCM10007868_24930 [Gluconobacter frateurii]